MARRAELRGGLCDVRVLGERSARRAGLDEGLGDAEADAPARAGDERRDGPARPGMLIRAPLPHCAQQAQDLVAQLEELDAVAELQRAVRRRAAR